MPCLVAMLPSSSSMTHNMGTIPTVAHKRRELDRTAKSILYQQRVLYSEKVLQCSVEQHSNGGGVRTQRRTTASFEKRAFEHARGKDDGCMLQVGCRMCSHRAELVACPCRACSSLAQRLGPSVVRPPLHEGTGLTDTNYGR